MIPRVEMGDAQRQLAKITGRVAARLRLQRALEAMTTAGVIFLLGASLLVYLFKAQVLSAGGFRLWLAGLALIPLGAGLIAAGRHISAVHAARLIDDSHDLHDRTSTAHEFCRTDEPTDWMRAQVQEALTHLPGVDLSRAAPYRVPREMRVFGLVAICLALTAILRFPAADPPPAVVVASAPRVDVDPDELADQRAMAKTLELQAQQDQQPELQRLAEELTKLFDDLEKKKLTRKELFAKLAELEKKLMDGLDGNFDDLLKRFKKMGGELQKEKLTKDLGKALKQGNLKQAKKDLEKLASEIDKLKKRDKRRVARRLQRAAKQKMPPNKKLQAQIKRLERQIRRLQRQLKKQANRQQRRRLQRKQRQLQRLNRQQQRLANQRRQLQRLNQQLNRAAQNLINKLTPQQRKALQQLAKQLGKFANQINKMRSMSKAQMNLRDLKEMLRRLGKGGKIRLAKMKSFRRRAGGKKGGKKGGKGNKTLYVLGPGGKMIPVPMPGQGQQPGGQGQQPGDGIGQGSDPSVKGQATKLPGRRKGVFVRGQESKGPTRSEVILGASDKGFATSHYRRVYRDYKQVIEDVLKREDVPLGYKYYVKRYFRLIKPR